MNIIKAVGICSIIIYLTFYFFLNRKIKEAKVVYTSLDDNVPFWAWTVIPYLFFYGVLLYGSIFISFLQTMNHFYEFIFSMFIVLTESFFIFIFFPTKVKEFTIVTTSIWNSLVNLVYTHDKRVAAFPSIHVGISIVTSYYLAQWYSWLVALFIFVAVSIIISTVTTKQHSVIDIVGGVLTGTSAILLGKILFASLSTYLWI